MKNTFAGFYILLARCVPKYFISSYFENIFCRRAVQKARSVRKSRWLMALQAI